MVAARRAELLGLLKGSGDLVQSLDQLLQLGRGWRGLGRSNILHHRLDLGGGILRILVDLLIQVANRLCGVLSHDAHVLGERGHGLDEGVHLGKLASRLGEWVPRRDKIKQNLRYPT